MIMLKHLLRTLQAIALLVFYVFGLLAYILEAWVMALYVKKGCPQ
jgi:hypothetical protein